jgi:hypothetical protein
VRQTAWLWIPAALLLVGCDSIPDTYAPPMQRNVQHQPGGHSTGHFVTMAGPDPDDFIVSGVLPGEPGSHWRWTGQRVELRFRLSSTSDLRFLMDFAIPETTFPQRGPVTLSFSVNDKLLGKMRCDKPGQFQFTQPVPADWLRTDMPTLVAAEIDRVYVAEADGARLGFILSRAGFVQ